MKFKSILKRTAAGAAAIGCLLLDVTAYASGGIFNPIYSGKFTFAQSSIEVSDSDVVLTKVWYKGETGFVSTNDPDSLIYDLSQFFVSYNHKGRVVDYYTGDFIR